MGETLSKVRLLDICDFISGNAHEQHISSLGEFTVINSKFVSTEGKVVKFASANFCPAKKDDITLVMSDLPNGKALGKCFLVPEDNKYAVNQRVCILRSKGFDPKYLFYILNRNPYFLSFNDGVSQTHLLNSVFEKCYISVTEDIKEQKAIAKTLSDINELISILTILKEKKQCIRKGILDTIVSGENVLNNSIRIKFKDYLDFTNGFSFKSSTYSNQGHYLIRITNVQAGKLVVNDKTYVNLNDSNLKQFELKIGDIVISLTGNVGRSAIINKDHTPAALNQRVGKISIKNEKKLELDKMYLYQILQSSKFMKMVIDMGEGAAQHNISLRDIGEMEWLIPIDYKEQKRISITLLDLDLEIETLDNELRKYMLIMQAMAHDLLTGKVRLV